ncbi:MAG: hypothetical protein AMXMBFR84_15330 [Candidatus Hydrogenedentota bacterium]
MEKPVEYAAPWSTALKLISTLSTALLVGIPLIATFSGPRSNPAWMAVMVLLPMATVVSCAIFVIRGYKLTKNAILIRRLGWHSTIDTSELTSVEADPEAMTRSIRLWGNGGLFCFSGLFRNKRLGTYRAYATNPSKSVVIRTLHRTFVVTPECPHGFVDEVRKIQGMR